MQNYVLTFVTHKLNNLMQNNIFRPTKENMAVLHSLIQDNYTADLSIRELTDKISKIQKVHETTVSKYLKSKGLKPREGRGSPSKLSSNPFALGEVDNEYWLGMMQTDGSISTRRNQHMILFNCEMDFLRTFHVHCGVKLGEFVKINPNRPVLQINFGHQETYQYLISLGFVCDKRKGFDFHYDLTYPLIRGIFDGDGSFRARGKDGISGAEMKITTGNPFLLERLKSFCHTHGTQWAYRVKGNSGDFFIQGGQQGIASFLNKLYAEGQYFNKAKFDKLKFLLDPEIRGRQEANWIRNQEEVEKLCNPELKAI